MNVIHFRRSTIEDFPEIIEFVSESKLPVSDIIPGKQLFTVAEAKNKIIGSAGLEVYGNNGLFRSLAVKPNYRNLKIGKDLLTKTINLCKDGSIKRLYLLTTTADIYFLKLGWKVIERNDVPEDIRLSSEFLSICPSTAVCMIYQL